MTDRRDTVVNVDRPATHTETVYRESSGGTSGILVLLILAAIAIGLVMFFLYRPGGAPDGATDTNVTVETPAAPAAPAEPAAPSPPMASEPATPPAAAPAPAPEPPAATPEPAPDASPAPAPAPAP